MKNTWKHWKHEFVKTLEEDRGQMGQRHLNIKVDCMETLKKMKNIDYCSFKEKLNQSTDLHQLVRKQVHFKPSVKNLCCTVEAVCHRCTAKEEDWCVGLESYELERSKKNGGWSEQVPENRKGCFLFPSILNRDSRDRPHQPHTHTHTQTTASSEVQFHRA